MAIAERLWVSELPAQQPMEHGHVEGAASHLQSLHSHSLNQKYLGISLSSKQHNTKTLYKNIVKGPHISIDNYFILIHIFNSFLTSARVCVLMVRTNSFSLFKLSLVIH